MRRMSRTGTDMEMDGAQVITGEHVDKEVAQQQGGRS